MVRALPSDLARLVLDYLYSEGLQNSYEVFLQECPHLEELRSFSSTGILPLGAKNLQAIVEEYYELIAQDTSKVKNTNDALFKLWRRCDALLVQIKHHYGVSTTMSGDMISQSVRSRYSLNRLHHERLQIERDHVLQANRANNSRQPGQQSLPQGQQLQPHSQQSQKQQRRQNEQEGRQQIHQRQLPQMNAEPDQILQLHPQQQVHSPQVQLQQHQEHQLQSQHGEQTQQRQTTLVQNLPTSNQAGEQVVTPVRTSTPRAVSPIREEIASPHQSVSSTQSQFMTPSKNSQSEKVIGKSPKRKSAPPRRKVTSGSDERLQHNMPSTSAGSGFMDDIKDLPSPWGSVVNNQELVEKLAENINRVLPTQETGTSEVGEPAEAIHEVEKGDQSSFGHQNLDDILGTVSDTVMEEFVDMTSSDPAFQSLFSLFNTDRDKFLNSELKKLSLSHSEVEDMNLSGESGEDSIAHPDSTGNVPPPEDPSSQHSGIQSQHSGLSSNSIGEAIVNTVHNSCAVETASKPGSHQQVLGSSVAQWPMRVQEPQANSGLAESSEAAETQISKNTEVQSTFPNMIVSRTSAIEGGLQDKHEVLAQSSGNVPGQTSRHIPLTSSGNLSEPASGNISRTPSGSNCGPSTSNIPGPPRTEKVLKACADSPQISKDTARTSKMIVKSISDFQHVRVLSFDGGAETSNEQIAYRIPRGSPHSTLSLVKGRSCSNGRRDGHGHPERDLGPLRNKNERTPCKRQVSQSPLRIYSPKEKIVAKLLTKLPVTPTKDFQMVETVNPSTLGGKTIYMITRKKTSASPMKTPAKTPAKSPSRKDRSTPQIQSDASGHHIGKDRTDCIFGTRVNDLPGHSKDRQEGHSREGLHSKDNLPNSHETVCIQSEASGQSSSSGDVKIRTDEGRIGERPAKAPSEGGAKVPRKKGVKRERKGEKAKGSKKSKQSKAKSAPSMVFPENLDVDKFLSQIHNE